MKNLQIEYVEIDKLTPFKNNSKIHTKEQIKYIANSIEKFGFDDKKLLKELDDLQKNFDFSQLGLSKQDPLLITDVKDDYFRDLLSHNKIKLVRNQFEMIGKYKIPIIKKQEIDMEKIDLINFNNTKHNDKNNSNKTVQFFTHDYRFDYVYSHPELAMQKLKQYYCLLSPDYSLYTDMPLALQIKNTFKNRWCGAYFQSLGKLVIPTIEWSDEESFEFCFDGVEEGSIVAVSTYGKSKIKEEYMKGYNEILRRIMPCAIICYEKPFPEMNGKIKVFPYNHNEWNDLKGGTN